MNKPPYAFSKAELDLLNGLYGCICADGAHVVAIYKAEGERCGRSDNRLWLLSCETYANSLCAFALPLHEDAFGLLEPNRVYDLRDLLREVGGIYDKTTEPKYD